MGHIDIAIYALIAGVLLVRLWSVFGRRNDDEPQRHNPFATPAAPEEDAKFQLDKGGPENAAQPPMRQMIFAPESLAGGLEQIKQQDPSFDEKIFLQDVRANFTTIVTGFGQGNLAEIEPLLGPTVLPGFKAAIEARQKANETMESRIERIRDAEVTTASMGESRAFITVRFTSEQENILRDASGKVLHGTPGSTEEIIDVWTFARDVKVVGTQWQLVETRS